MELAYANQIIAQVEFDQRLLVQRLLNPGLPAVMSEILTVDDRNEVIEVPVTKDYGLAYEGLKCDDALTLGRKCNVLLVSINRGGADGAAPGPGGDLPRMLTNPFKPEGLPDPVRRFPALPCGERRGVGDHVRRQPRVEALLPKGAFAWVAE